MEQGKDKFCLLGKSYSHHYEQKVCASFLKIEMQSYLLVIFSFKHNIFMANITDLISFHSRYSFSLSGNIKNTVIMTRKLSKKVDVVHHGKVQ